MSKTWLRFEQQIAHRFLVRQVRAARRDIIRDDLREPLRRVFVEAEEADRFADRVVLRPDGELLAQLDRHAVLDAQLHRLVAGFEIAVDQQAVDVRVRAATSASRMRSS